MYNGDLAYIQHHGFARFAESVGPGVLAELRRAGITSGRLLDLGCGDGTWLRTLIRHGYAAEGIEQSRGLAKYAARVLGAKVKVASIHEASIPRCDGITALGEVLSYYRTDGSPPSIGRLFRRVYAALRPGGVFIFDVLIAGKPMDYETWRAGSTWAVLTRVYEEPRWRRLVREITTFRKRRAGYRRGYETHVLKVYPRQAILTALGRAGFRARAQRGYGRALLPYRRGAFIARKTGGSQ